MRVTFSLIATLTLAFWNGSALAANITPVPAPVPKIVESNLGIRTIIKNRFQLLSRKIDAMERDHKISAESAKSLRANLESTKRKFNLESKLSEEDIKSVSRELLDNDKKIWATFQERKNSQ